MIIFPLNYGEFLSAIHAQMEVLDVLERDKGHLFLSDKNNMIESNYKLSRNYNVYKLYNDFYENKYNFSFTCISVFLASKRPDDVHLRQLCLINKNGYGTDINHR